MRPASPSARSPSRRPSRQSTAPAPVLHTAHAPSDSSSRSSAEGSPRIPLASVPLAAVPLAGVPLAGVPLAGVPLAGVPLAGVPLVGVPLVGIPMQRRLPDATDRPFQAPPPS